jgi:hypothetical protein
MIDERYKWLYSYTLPCTGGKEVLFERLLEQGSVVQELAGDYSRKSVRKHFLGTHNIATLEGLHEKDAFHRAASYQHLAVPYEVKKSEGGLLVCELRKQFYQELTEILSPALAEREFKESQIREAKDRGVLSIDSKVIITHAGIIAESCSLAEIAEFDDLFERQKSP